MDPFEAFRALLSNENMLEHAEALVDWLSKGGFFPCLTKLPKETYDLFPQLGEAGDPWVITATTYGLVAHRPHSPHEEVVNSLDWLTVLDIAGSRD